MAASLGAFAFMSKDRDKIAYMAGLFDGEGSIAIYQGSLFLTINMTHEPTIRWVGANFGGSVTGPHKVTSQKHRPCYRWRTVSSQAMALLGQLIPHLITKQAQAAIAMQLWEEQMFGEKSALNSNHYSEMAQARQALLIERFHLANRKGAQSVG